MKARVDLDVVDGETLQVAEEEYPVPKSSDRHLDAQA